MFFLYETRIAYNNVLKKIWEDPDHFFFDMVEEAVPHVQRYRDEGWNLQMLSLGTTINATKYVEDPRLFAMDEIHPSCRSMRQISDMIQYVIYSDIASCGVADFDKAVDHNNVSIPEPKVTDTLEDISTLWVRDLWQLLLREDVRVGTYTAWLPSMPTPSNLNISNLEELHNQPKVNGAKSYPDRADRKLFHTIPTCNLEMNDSGI